MPVLTKIQIRRDTAANWTSTNPTLAAGEMGFETDTLLFKVGNGSTAWTSLAYASTSGATGPMGPTGPTGATGPTGLVSSHGFTTGDYYTFPISSSSSANFQTANRTNYTLFYIPTTTTFDRIATRTGATFSGTSSIRLGIYNNTDFKPSTVLLDAGTVSATAASTLYEITISQTLNEGFYWLAWNAQTVATTNNIVLGDSVLAFNMSPVTSTGTRFATYTQTGVTGAFATAGSLGTGTNPPLVYLRR